MRNQSQEESLMLPIKATCIDEITHDIPSQNWGEKEWEADFKAMKAAGIDTVVIIRAGYKDKVIFPSKALKLHADFDLAELFLSLADRYAMKLYFGTYDSGKYWSGNAHAKELELVLPFVDEVVERYGRHESFHGWYMSNEVGKREFDIEKIYQPLSAKIRKVSPGKPILISPFIWGRRLVEKFLPPKEYKAEWDELLKSISGTFDILAVQVAPAGMDEIGDYLRGFKEQSKKHKFELWANVETFSSEIPVKGVFFPIDIRDLVRKLNIVSPYVSNIITFEFSHFMSPNSSNPSAGRLYERYLEQVLNVKR